MKVEQIYNIINTRINMGLPTIISTNLTLSEIESIYSKKISSRILEDKIFSREMASYLA